MYPSPFFTTKAPRTLSGRHSFTFGLQPHNFAVGIKVPKAAAVPQFPLFCWRPWRVHMPRIKLTEKAIERLPTGTGKQTLFWDDGPRAIRGFGVLCSGKTQTKTYVVQRDMPNGRTRRVTIAGVNELSLDAARKHAADVAVELRRGIDPKRKIVKSTLRQVLDAYRAARSDLRPRSLEHYASIERARTQ